MNRKLKCALNNYNWDDGLDLPKKLLAHPDCDLALALEIFYLADGYAYLTNMAENTSQTEWKSFIETLYTDILDGRYAQTDCSFEIPLSKVQKHKLKTRQIPDIFIADI